METALRHIGNVITTGNGDASQIYLDALDEHLHANTSQRDIAHVLDTINFLLTKAKTRKFGLEFLDKVLPFVKHDLLEQKLQLWITFVLKACNQDELRRYGGLIFKSLRNLANILRQHAGEVSKNFVSNHLNKVYEVIAQSPDEYFCSALKCAETYLAAYPKPNGQSRDTIQRFLNNFLDKYNDEVVNYYVGRCMHFLQQTTVPGVGLKSGGGGKMEQWKEYQLYLIDSLDGMLEEAYGGGENGTKSNDQRGKESSILPSLQLSPEPNVRASQIFVRFHNLINYLRTALSVPNNLQAPQIHQSTKPIAVKKILNLINRGFVRTCAAALNQNGTYSKVAFGVFLPKIQLDLLELTKTLMRTLHCHLRMHYKSLLGCLIHVLKSTAPSSAATHKSTVVRTQVYNLIALWCQLLGEGSRCELYADELIPELLSDITIENNEFVQQIQTKNERKNNKTTPAAPKRKESLTKSSSSSSDETTTAYLAAIKCLQSLLRSCAYFMKPNMLTTIQMTTLKHCATLFVVKRPEIYGNWKIRLEMYRLLHTIMRTPNQYSPPASQIIIYILHEAQSTESNTEIRLACTEMLEEIEKILHPQKESLIIPIEARAIRNAYSRLGKEAVLEQYHDAISSLRWNQGMEVVENQRNGNCTLDKVDIAPTAPVMEPEIYSPPKNKRNATRDLNDGIKELAEARQEVSSPIRKESTSVDEETDDDAPPHAKKQKNCQSNDSGGVQESPITIGSDSDESSIEIENLTTPRQAPVQNHSNKSMDIREDEMITKAGNQIVREKSKSPPLKSDNPMDDIAELEALFVDELKGESV